MPEKSTGQVVNLKIIYQDTGEAIPNVEIRFQLGGRSQDLKTDTAGRGCCCFRTGRGRMFRSRPKPTELFPFKYPGAATRK